MSNDLFLARDLQRELLALVNSSQTFSDIHIEQDQPLTSPDLMPFTATIRLPSDMTGSSAIVDARGGGTTP